MFDGRTGAEPGLVIGHEPPETLADSLAGSGPGRAAAERRTGGWGGPVRNGDEHGLHQRLARAVETINPASGPDRRHRPAGQDDPGAAAGSRRSGRGRGGGGRRDLGSVSAPAGLADSRRRVGPLHRHGAATRSGLPRRADRVGDHQRQVLATGHGQTGHRRGNSRQPGDTRLRSRSTSRTGRPSSVSGSSPASTASPAPRARSAQVLPAATPGRQLLMWVHGASAS